MKANETKLRKLLEGTQQYVIPLFQRQYTWGLKQWQTLWNDINELYYGDIKNEHFMASVVTMLTQSKPEGVTKYLVIDGQQRITTFYIILAVIRDLQRQNKNLVFEIETYFLFNKIKSENEYYKLLPTQQNDDRSIFFRIMNGVTNDILTIDSQMVKAYNYFFNQLQSYNIDI